MDIKFDANDVSAVVTKAIMESISPEKRDEIVQAAVSELLVPVKTNRQYGYSNPDAGKSQLQIAFERACTEAALTVAREYVLAHPEITAKLDELMGTVVLAMTSDASTGSYQLRDALGAAIGSAVSTHLANRKDY